MKARPDKCAHKGYALKAKSKDFYRVLDDPALFKYFRNSYRPARAQDPEYLAESRKTRNEGYYRRKARNAISEAGGEAPDEEVLRESYRDGQKEDAVRVRKRPNLDRMRREIDYSAVECPVECTGRPAQKPRLPFSIFIALYLSTKSQYRVTTSSTSGLMWHKACDLCRLNVAVYHKRQGLMVDYELLVFIASQKGWCLGPFPSCKIVGAIMEMSRENKFSLSLLATQFMYEHINRVGKERTDGMCISHITNQVKRRSAMKLGSVKGVCMGCGSSKTQLNNDTKSLRNEDIEILEQWEEEVDDALDGNGDVDTSEIDKLLDKSLSDFPDFVEAFVPHLEEIDLLHPTRSDRYPLYTLEQTRVPGFWESLDSDAFSRRR